MKKLIAILLSLMLALGLAGLTVLICIIGIIVVNELHARDGIAGLIQLSEDVDEILGNGFVAHHLSLMNLSINIIVEHLQIAQVSARNGAIMREGPSLHANEHPVADSIDGETRFHYFLGKSWKA